jgi:hypothetical protein
MGEISAREAAILLGKRLDDTYKLLHAQKITGRKRNGIWFVDAVSVESYRKHSSRSSVLAGQATAAGAE